MCVHVSVGIYAPVIFLLLPQWALADSTLNQTARQCRQTCALFPPSLSLVHSLLLALCLSWFASLAITHCLQPHAILYFSPSFPPGFVSLFVCFLTCFIHYPSLSNHPLSCLISHYSAAPTSPWQTTADTMPAQQPHTLKHTHTEDERMCSGCAEKHKGTSGWVLVQTVCDRAMQIC